MWSGGVLATFAGCPGPVRVGPGRHSSAQVAQLGPTSSLVLQSKTSVYRNQAANTQSAIIACLRKSRGFARMVCMCMLLVQVECQQVGM